MRSLVFAFVLILGGCVAIPGLNGEPLTHSQKMAAAQKTAEIVFDQAVEFRIEGSISDAVWLCVKTLASAIDRGLGSGDLVIVRSQTRLLRRAARENFDVCN